MKNARRGEGVVREILRRTFPVVAGPAEAFLTSLELRTVGITEADDQGAGLLCSRPSVLCWSDVAASPPPSEDVAKSGGILGCPDRDI